MEAGARRRDRGCASARPVPRAGGGDGRPGGRPGFASRTAWLKLVPGRGLLAVSTVGVLALVGARLWLNARARARILAGPPALGPGRVAIVPGAAVRRDGTPAGFLSNRLETALRLYRAGKVERILISGARCSWNQDEVRAMREWLLDRGVPEAALLVDAEGSRTLETMRNARAFGVREAIICSQAFHLPRALFLARSAGLEAWGMEADPPRRLTSRRNRWREQLASAWAIVEVCLLGRLGA